MEYSKNIIKEKKGAVLLFAALLLPLLFAFAGLAFDLGNMYAHHSRLQNSADASALAGAAVFDTRTDSETSHGTSDQAAAKFLRLNNEGLEGLTMDPPQVRVDDSNRYYYRVHLRQEIPYYILRYFRSVLGDYINIQATAYAMIPSYKYGEGDGTESGKAPGFFDNLFTSTKHIHLQHATENPDVYHRYDLTTKEGVEQAIKDNQRIEISSFFNGDMVYGGNLITQGFIFNSKAEPYRKNALEALKDSLTDYVQKPTYDPSLKKGDIDGYIAEAEKIAKANTTYQGSSNGKQSFSISDINNNGPSYNGYHYTNHNGGALSIDTGLQGDSNEPFYVVLHKASNPRISMSSGVDTNRPVIYCYLGNGAVEVSGASGSTFRGIIYAPNASQVHINDNGWTFNGSIVANHIHLEAKGTYNHVNYLGGNSGDQGPGENNNKNVILVLPPEGIDWDK